jgi:ribose transport system permease protein
MVFLLSMREIDLSVGSIYAVVIMECAILMSDGHNPWLVAAIGLVIGMGLGAANGILANLFGLPALIITIGTLSMYRGLTLILSDNRYISGLPRDHAFFTFFGGVYYRVPASVWAFGILAAVLTVLFRSTRYGFVVRAIGSNEDAARLSGIPISRIRVVTLTLSGLLSAISGLLTLAYFQSADPNLGAGYELLVIAAAVIGGTSLAGGSGTVLGAVLGALLISVISSGLIQFGVSANWSSFVTGAVIIGAVGLDALIRRRRRMT